MLPQHNESLPEVAQGLQIEAEPGHRESLQTE